jgi:hypothetical protein
MALGDPDLLFRREDHFGSGRPVEFRDNLPMAIGSLADNLPNDSDRLLWHANRGLGLRLNGGNLLRCCGSGFGIIPLVNEMGGFGHATLRPRFDISQSVFNVPPHGALSP